MPAAEVLQDAPVVARPRIGRHVAGLALVLLALAPLLGRDGLFSADEGAAAAQARLLSEERGWTLDHPLPDLDPSGRTFPLENANLTTDGEGRPAGAPFAKHPAYAVLLVPVDRALGVLGMALTSVAGAVLAAGLAGLLTRRLAPDLAPLAVWGAGLATPLFFDAWLVIAHTLGAALVAAATLSVLRADEGRGGPALLATAAAMAGAVLLRNEALLFGIALAITAMALGWRRSRRPLVLGGAAALVGTAGGCLLDGVLSAAVAGDAEASFEAGVSGSGFVAGRVLGAVVTLVLPSYDGLGLPDLLLVLTAGALVGAVVVARRRPDDADGLRLLLVVAAASAVARAVVAPEVVPGLLVAAPLLTAGLAALTGHTVATTPARLLAGTATLFAGAVLATQYASGGSGEWGGRYFALALPLVVPLVVVAGRDLLAGLSPRVARTAALALAVVALAVPVSAGRALLHTRDRTETLVAAIEETSTTLHDPVVVATAGAAPRFAWEDVLAGDEWLLVDLDEASAWLGRLSAEGRDVVVATPDPERVDGTAAGFEERGRDAVGQGSTWTVIALAGERA